jgi:hypothetical protein
VAEYDVWLQDCPPGQKCVPWANDGGDTWNATRCSWVEPDPMHPGEPCTVQGSPTSGFDDCDATSVCWHVDPNTNEGVCKAFCMGSPDAPTCSDESWHCELLIDGLVPLCRVVCDPVFQDCPDGQGCYPFADMFDCYPDRSGSAGQYGDPCDRVDACDPGLFCASASLVPGCQAPLGCCSEFCNLDAPDPNAECSGAAQGQECVPWWEGATSPPGYEHVGACVLPP